MPEMMPEHARWFAGSAEGLADADAAAERLPRAEGPCRSCLGVRVRRVARKGRFAPPGLAGSPCHCRGPRGLPSVAQGPLRHPRRSGGSGAAWSATRRRSAGASGSTCGPVGRRRVCTGSGIQKSCTHFTFSPMEHLFSRRRTIIFYPYDSERPKMLRSFELSEDLRLQKGVLGSGPSGTKRFWRF